MHVYLAIFQIGNMTRPRFAAAVCCMDGRIQRAVYDWVASYAGVPYVDMITEAGSDGILSRQEPVAVYRGIYQRLRIAAEVHGARVVAVVGHEDCAGHPVDEAQHRRDIRRGMGTVRQWFPDVAVVGLWVRLNGEVVPVV